MFEEINKLLKQTADMQNRPRINFCLTENNEGETKILVNGDNPALVIKAFVLFRGEADKVLKSKKPA